jgi:hypothetical protein
MKTLRNEIAAVLFTNDMKDPATFFSHSVDEIAEVAFECADVFMRVMGEMDNPTKADCGGECNACDITASQESVKDMLDSILKDFMPKKSEATRPAHPAAPEQKTQAPIDMLAELEELYGQAPKSIRDIFTQSSHTDSELTLMESFLKLARSK